MAPKAARAGGLFRQILDWMLVPLVVLWPATVVATYLAASAIADATFDRELRDMTRAVAEEVRTTGRAALLERQLSVVSALRNDPVEKTYVQIVTPSGRILLGDDMGPLAPDLDAVEAPLVLIRDGIIRGETVRIGWSWIPEDGASEMLLVQVGDPISRRRGLVGNVTALVMAMVTLLVPIMVALVWFGLWRGLRPLRALRERIEARSAQDLSPIPPEDAPAELAPLMTSLNLQLDRVRGHLESQRRFVADAAHQLRTPLAGLKAQADAALRGGTLDEARARLERIEESADRLSRLVAQLLSLARADDARARSTPLEAVDLDALLRDVCESAAESAMARQVELGFDPSGAPATVEGAPLLLRELFANLVDNAIRYTPEGGEVSVRVEAQPTPCVWIEDSGIGIPQAERERVFERFHRVLGTGASGSGLGLPIVRTIAELHGAEVEILDRESGRGTVFRVGFRVRRM